MCGKQKICGYWRHLLFKVEDKALSKENKNEIIVQRVTMGVSQKQEERGMARHASNLKAQEVEAGGSL